MMEKGDFFKIIIFGIVYATMFILVGLLFIC
jgi:hypothetical protein